MSPRSDFVSQHTRQWIEDVVIGLNLCPFAKPSWKVDQWEIVVIDKSDHLELIDEAIAAIKERLNQVEHNSLENIFLVMPNCTDDFLAYFNLCSIIEMELDIQRVLEQVQMVVFHPTFRFEGESEDARGNYVNRSPFPMIHFLKKATMDKIVEKYGEDIGAEISFNNKKSLDSLSDSEFEEKVNSYLRKANWP